MHYAARFTKLQRHCSPVIVGSDRPPCVLRGIIAEGQGCWSRLALVRRKIMQNIIRVRAETVLQPRRERSSGRLETPDWFFADFFSEFLAMRRSKHSCDNIIQGGRRRRIGKERKKQRSRLRFWLSPVESRRRRKNRLTNAFFFPSLATFRTVIRLLITHLSRLLSVTGDPD